MITEIDDFIKEVSKLPTLGQRSARKIVLFLLKNKERMKHLTDIMLNAMDKIKTCVICGNLGLSGTCAICNDQSRDTESICIVENIDDLWVIERSGCFKGKYHVLNGLLSAVDEITPESLRLNTLIERCKRESIKEVIIGLNITLDSRITACYISDLLQEHNIKTTNLASGIPVGGELNYLDDSTITIAFQDRK